MRTQGEVTTAALGLSTETKNTCGQGDHERVDGVPSLVVSPRLARSRIEGGGQTKMDCVGEI